MGIEANVRIDKGIKRGPRKPQERIRRSPKADLGGWIIPKDLKPETVLERYLTESTTSQIAAEYGLSRKALVRWLRETVPNEWKQVKAIRAYCRKEDGDEELDASCDALSLARAREMLKSAQWDLERLDHADYGVKQEVTVKTEEHISLVLEGDVAGLIERIAAKRQALQVIDLPSDAVQHLDKPNP